MGTDPASTSLERFGRRVGPRGRRLRDLRVAGVLASIQDEEEDRRGLRTGCSLSADLVVGGASLVRRGEDLDKLAIKATLDAGVL